MEYNEERKQANWTYCLDMLDWYIDICKRNNIQYQLAYGSVLGAIRHKGFIPWDVNIDTSMTLDNYKKFYEVCRLDGSVPERFKVVDSDNGDDKGRKIIRIIPSGMDQEMVDYYYFPNLDISIYCGAPSNAFASRCFLFLSFINNKVFRLKNIDNIKRKFPWNVLKALLIIVPNSFLEWQYQRIVNYRDFQSAQRVICVETVYGNELFDKDCVDKSIVATFEGREVNVPKDYDRYLRTIYGDYKTPKKRK